MGCARTDSTKGIGSDRRAYEASKEDFRSFVVWNAGGTQAVHFNGSTERALKEIVEKARIHSTLPRLVHFNGSTERALKDARRDHRCRNLVFPFCVHFNGSTERALKDRCQSTLWHRPGFNVHFNGSTERALKEVRTHSRHPRTSVHFNGSTERALKVRQRGTVQGGLSAH